MATRIQLRGDTAANWAANNPKLAARELVIETDTLKIKIGDGDTYYKALSYATLPVYNGLDKTVAGFTLDARQGKALSDAIATKASSTDLTNGLADKAPKDSPEFTGEVYINDDTESGSENGDTVFEIRKTSGDSPLRVSDLGYASFGRGFDFYGDTFLVRELPAPASASATGTAGEVRFIGNYIYRCVDTDTWIRFSGATW